MKAIVTPIVMALMVLGSAPAKGGGDPATRSFFGPDSILDLELRFEFDSLMSDVREDPSYYPAILVYNDPEDHGRIEMNIRVRARGSFRRKPENCDFPPLKFKFDKEDRQGTLFENLKELKVVTHCQNDHMEFDQFVLQEFLIYRAYNLFTEFSFRVRLARITYVDLYGNADPITRMAFLIEDAEDMAERNHADLLDLKTVSSTQLNQDIFALMAMFNYMMLNTDYSVPLLHNIELVSTDYFEPPVPVPFDFDWSGMINIPYDSPYASARNKFTDRIYKGPCLRKKNLERVIDTMYARRDELYGIYRDCPYLEEDLKLRTLQELDLFYITIGNRKLVRQEFIHKCKD